MRHHIPKTRSQREALLSPSRKATLLPTLAFIVVPVAAMVLVSHPVFSAGIIVGGGLLYFVENARKIIRSRRSRHRDSSHRSLVRSILHQPGRARKSFDH